MKKIFFFFLVSLSCIFTMQLPHITSNETLMRLIKNDIKTMSKSFDYFQIHRDLREIGINLSDIEDIDALLLEGFSYALGQGIPLKNFIQESKEEGIYFPNISITQIKDYAKLLQQGVENALATGDIDNCKILIKQAEELGVPLDLSTERLKGHIQQAIACIFIDDLNKKKQYFLYLIDFVQSLNIDLSAIEIEKGVEKGLEHCMKIQDFIAKRNASLIPNIYDLEIFQKLAVWNQKKGIAFSLAKIPNMLSYVTKNIQKFLSPADIAYLNNNGIIIQWQNFPNLKDVLEDAITTTLLHEHILLNSFSFTFADSNESEEDKAYEEPISFLYKIAKDNDISIDQNVVSEKLKLDIQKIIKEEISKYSRFWTTKKIARMIADAKHHNVNISLAHIPNIEDAFKKGIFDILSIENNIKDFLHILQFAEDNNISLNIEDILYDKLKEEIAAKSFEEIRILKELQQINISLDISQIPELNEENLFLESLISSLHYHNKGEVHQHIRYLQEQKLNPDLMQKGFQEAIYRSIADATIRDIHHLIHFFQKMKYDIALNTIPNIEKAFYEGCEKALHYRARFIFEYLLQLAKDNNVLLDNHIIEDFSNRWNELQNSCFKGIMLEVYPEAWIPLNDMNKLFCE